MLVVQDDRHKACHMKEAIVAAHNVTHYVTFCSVKVFAEIYNTNYVNSSACLPPTDTRVSFPYVFQCFFSQVVL
jgi:hypothetical protein